MMSNQDCYLKEVRESQKVFSALVIAMEKSHKGVIAAIEERQRDEVKRVETLVKELKQEIQELRKETTESGDQSDDTEPTDLVSTLIYCRQHDDDDGEALNLSLVYFM